MRRAASVKPRSWANMLLRSPIRWNGKLKCGCNSNHTGYVNAAIETRPRSISPRNQANARILGALRRRATLPGGVQPGEYFLRRRDGGIDVQGGMRRRQKSGFIGRRCEVDACIQHGVEKPPEPLHAGGHDLGEGLHSRL